MHTTQSIVSKYPLSLMNMELRHTSSVILPFSARNYDISKCSNDSIGGLHVIKSHQNISIIEV